MALVIAAGPRPKRTTQRLRMSLNLVPGPELQLPSSDPKRVSGPDLVELDGSTLWIPPGWVGVRDGPSWVVTRE